MDWIKRYCEDIVIPEQWALLSDKGKETYGLTMIVVIYNNRADNKNQNIENTKNEFIKEAIERL